MTTRVLLNAHRQELHQLLVKAGVDPAIANWTRDPKGWTSSDVETLEVGLCFFVFKEDTDGTYSVFVKPGVDGGASKGLVNQNWEMVHKLFAHWSNLVEHEISQTDPWQQYSVYLPPERSGLATDNSPYTHGEAERVAASLQQFREQIRQQLPQYNGVAKQFDPQFERLAAQAKKGLGRIDWSNQFVGMLISLCIGLSLAPEQAAALWKSWGRIIGQLLLP